MVTKAFSTEDGNLSSSIAVARNRAFSDIDLSFQERPSGDIYKKVDVAAVKQAVKNLLLTNYGEKPFKPYFGANLSGLLFENAGPALEEDINDRVRRAIRLYEPRAIVRRVVVSSSTDYNSLWVRVDFQVVNVVEIQSVEITLSRLR